MRVNTKSGAIDLTKHERRILEQAKALLLSLHKHGEGALAQAAEEGAEQIGLTLAELQEPVAA